MIKDICIYTTERTLNHKRDLLSKKEDNDKSNVGVYFWALSNEPKSWCGERIYFAINKHIVGYFEVIDFDEHECEVEFDSKSWTNIKPIPTKPFQGFKYVELRNIKSENKKYKVKRSCQNTNNDK